MRLLASGLVCFVLAFLLAAHGQYGPGAFFVVLGSAAWIACGALMPSDAERDAWRRHHTGPDRRA